MHGLQKKLELFRKCDQLAQQALEKIEGGVVDQPALDEINLHLQSVAEIDQSGPGDEGQVDRALVKSELQTVLESLIRTTAEVESKIRMARENLNPQVNQHVTASRMHRAYKANR